MPTPDENIYSYAIQKNPALAKYPKAQVLAYARTKLEGRMQPPGAEFTPDQMRVKQQPEQVPYIDAISKGLMQEPLPEGQSFGRKLVHGAYQELPPTLGAIAGAPAGLPGMMAGAAAGRATQKGLGVFSRAITGEEPSQETPAEAIGDVALTGALQGVGGKAVGTGLADEAVTGGISARLRPNAPVWPSGVKSGGQPRQLIRGSLTETPLQKTPATTPSGAIGALRKGETKSKELGIAEVNALLKPKTVNYVYGKNPGKGVLEEGITGKTFEDIHAQLENKLQEIGTQYKPLFSKYKNKRVNVDAFTNPLDVALEKAKRNPRTNKPLLTRLENAKRDLRMELDVPETGGSVGGGNFKRMSPQQALELKRAIGEITKFTADTQEDNIVNAALKQAYHIIDNKLDLAVPGSKHLNERYANVLGATVAARNKALLGMNKRQWVTPVAEIAAGAGMGAMAGKPFTGMAMGVAGAAAHKLAQSPRFVVGTARALHGPVSSGFGKAAQGLERFAETQVPQSGVRRGLEVALEPDPLGLFND